VTDYRDINENDVRVDAELTSQLFDKLRLNPLATAEGSQTGDTPPPFKIESLEDSTCNAETKDRLVAYRLVQRRGSNGCEDNVFTTRWKANRGGSYAVHLYKVDNSSTSSRVYVNDIEVDSSTSDNAWYVINVNLGDIIYFELRTASNSSSYEYMHCYIYTSNPFSDFECLGGIEVKKDKSSGGATFIKAHAKNLAVDIY